MADQACWSSQLSKGIGVTISLIVCIVCVLILKIIPPRKTVEVKVTTAEDGSILKNVNAKVTPNLDLSDKDRTGPTQWSVSIQDQPPFMCLEEPDVKQPFPQNIQTKLYECQSKDWNNCKVSVQYAGKMYNDIHMQYSDVAKKLIGTTQTFYLDEEHDNMSSTNIGGVFRVLSEVLFPLCLSLGIWNGVCIYMISKLCHYEFPENIQKSCPTYVKEWQRAFHHSKIMDSMNNASQASSLLPSNIGNIGKQVSDGTSTVASGFRAWHDLLADHSLYECASKNTKNSWQMFLLQQGAFVALPSIVVGILTYKLIVGKIDKNHKYNIAEYVCIGFVCLITAGLVSSLCNTTLRGIRRKQIGLDWFIDWPRMVL